MIHILHLSDIHLGTVDEAGQYQNQLTTDLNVELEIQSLDYLVISGDIGTYSTREEYEAAAKLVTGIAKRFNIKRERLIIVPGNHDLNWKLSKKAYSFVDKDDLPDPLPEEMAQNAIPAGDPGMLIRNEKSYRKRFGHFSRHFYESVVGKAYPEDYEKQGMVFEDEENRILFLCLNSSREIDPHHPSRSGIHPNALVHALEAQRECSGKDWLKIAVWHHPVTGNQMMKETDFLEQLSVHGFKAVLHGHLHEAQKDEYEYDPERKIRIIGAGTFGAPVPEQQVPGIPLQYNLLAYDPDKGVITVHTRKKEKPLGAWSADPRWQSKKDPKSFYEIKIRDAVAPPAPIEIPPDAQNSNVREVSDTRALEANILQNEIERYRKKCEALHSRLHLAGFRISLRVPIRLEEIYVPLRAMIDMRLTGDAWFADAGDAENKLRECRGGCEISVPDAFREMKKSGRRGIMILGDPGSGKTTHLKRVLLWCLKGGQAGMGLPPDMIPVFLPLRELRDVRMNLKEFIQEQLCHPHLETPPGFGERLLERGSLLFLLDGLDEVAESGRRKSVSRWIEEALTVYDSCRFVVTSRFAGYTGDARLGPDFLEMHMRPMDEDQASRFIHNWFRIVKRDQHPDKRQAERMAADEAQALIERLKAPDFRAGRVFEMTRNPLLLTCLCLVHLDRGNLPHTRAGLYDECTDVLLERWRGAAGIRTRIKADAGRRVLQPAALWMHREENRTRASAKELAPVIEKPLKAVGWAHGSAEDFLKAVRDESGILTGWDREHYGFMHLGFQEYLAAREIRSLYLSSRDRSVLRELAGHFGESWWQEVSLLLPALEEPSLFKPFMKEVVKLPAFAEHVQLVEMCLEDSVETYPDPFLELTALAPGTDRELWKRQLAALRILERMDETLVARMAPNLKNHPDETIRKWIAARAGERAREIITAKRGGYELVRIPAGVFMMGSPESEEGRFDDEGPRHEVRVDEFFMGRCPVTNQEYGRFLEENPDAEKPEYWGDRQYNQPAQPVVGVSWHDAKRYADWAGLDLPTEPQWEYACRAGTTTRFYTGDKEEDLDRAGWYGKNSGGRLHPVGEKEPNAWGLHDMHGNIFEWTRSLMDENFGYPYDPNDGREDMSSGSYRVVRGGSWDFEAVVCRTAYRGRFGPGDRNRDHGFRLVCLPGHEQEKQAGK